MYIDYVELAWNRGTTLPAKASFEGAPGLDKPKEEQPGEPEANSGSEQSLQDREDRAWSKRSTIL